MGARFSAGAVHYVFSRRPPSASVPAGVHFVTESIRAFVERLHSQAGKNAWMMGGGEIIGSFLDEGAIDEFIVTVVPTFIGEGIPLLGPRYRAVALRLLGVQQFTDGVVQLHYEVQRAESALHTFADIVARRAGRNAGSTRSSLSAAASRSGRRGRLSLAESPQLRSGVRRSESAMLQRPADRRRPL